MDELLGFTWLEYWNDGLLLSTHCSNIPSFQRVREITMIDRRTRLFRPGEGDDIEGETGSLFRSETL